MLVKGIIPEITIFASENQGYKSMFTNRDEVLEKALRIFAKMNYEKASQMEIARTCGLSKAGLTYYFPFKQDLFTAVADRYVFDTQHSKTSSTSRQAHCQNLSTGM